MREVAFRLEELGRSVRGMKCRPRGSDLRERRQLSRVGGEGGKGSHEGFCDERAMSEEANSKRDWGKGHEKNEGGRGC